MPPPVALMHLITGRWVSHVVGVVAELGLADDVHQGKSVADIATAKGLDATALHRLMRAASGVGVFAEKEGAFVQTPMSDALRSDVPYSMRGMARMVNLECSIKAWTQLEYSVRTNASAFEHVFGRRGFEYFEDHPRDRDIFANAMSSFSAQVGAAVTQAYDFSTTKVLADIGGSHGTLVALALARFPHLKGIVFDLPGVVGGARAHLQQHGVADRVEAIAGDFFDKVPSGADVYLMKSILHDWSDADSTRILKAIHTAAEPGAKLLLVEGILDNSPATAFLKVLDVEMLVITSGGKERTLPEWQALLASGGWRFTRVVPTASPLVIIESVRD
jgi:hypothetical protein